MLNWVYVIALFTFIRRRIRDYLVKLNIRSKRIPTFIELRKLYDKYKKESTLMYEDLEWSSLLDRIKSAGRIRGLVNCAADMFSVGGSVDFTPHQAPTRGIGFNR